MTSSPGIQVFMPTLYGGSIDHYHTTCILILNVIKCERYDLMLNALLIGIQPLIYAIQLILIYFDYNF